jgi:hypothetical protein
MPWGDEDMTGSFNTSHYEDIRGRVLGVLISVAESLSRRQVDLLHELIDQNESGVALEMLVEMLFEVGASLEKQAIDDMLGLANTMKLPSDTADRVRSLGLN